RHGATRRSLFAPMLAGLLATTGLGIPSARANPDNGELRAALRRYADEPSIERVLTLAMKHANMDPDRASSLATRARLRGLVPVLRVGVRRGRGQDLSAYLAEDDRTRLSTGDDLSIQGWATFSLDRLVFATEE